MRPDSQSNGPASIIKLNLVICIMYMYWYYVVYIMYYVLCVVYYVLCVMYYVLCMMRCVFCIMYYRLYIAIHGLSGSWPPQVPESPAGVGSRLEILRGVGVDPRGPTLPCQAGTGGSCFGW